MDHTSIPVWTKGNFSYRQKCLFFLHTKFNNYTMAQTKTVIIGRHHIFIILLQLCINFVKLGQSKLEFSSEIRLQIVP
jgi:hypothetical protein